MSRWAPFVGWSDFMYLKSFRIIALGGGTNAQRQITFASPTGRAYSRASVGQKIKEGEPMKSAKRTAVILALGLAAGGCAILDTKPVAREDLTNAQGHVVGYKEMMRDSRTGEEVAQIALYVPQFGQRGEIIGYEERVRGGGVLHDLNGKRIGGRLGDRRCRRPDPPDKRPLLVVRGQGAGSRPVGQPPPIEDPLQLPRL